MEVQGESKEVLEESLCESPTLDLLIENSIKENGFGVKALQRTILVPNHCYNVMH